MVAPPDNARAVLDFLAGCEMAVYRRLQLVPSEGLWRASPALRGLPKTRRLRQDLILKAQSLQYNTTGEA